MKQQLKNLIRTYKDMLEKEKNEIGHTTDSEYDKAWSRSKIITLENVIEDLEMIS